MKYGLLRIPFILTDEIWIAPLLRNSRNPHTPRTPAVSRKPLRARVVLPDKLLAADPPAHKWARPAAGASGLISSYFLL